MYRDVSFKSSQTSAAIRPSTPKTFGSPKETSEFIAIIYYDYENYLPISNLFTPKSDSNFVTNKTKIKDLEFKISSNLVNVRRTPIKTNNLWLGSLRIRASDKSSWSKNVYRLSRDRKLLAVN